MKDSVRYINRKRSVSKHSIELIFDSIRTILYRKHGFETSAYEVKNIGGDPFTLFKNLFSFRREKGTVYHITGDVQYMALVTGRKTILTVHDIDSILKGHFFKRLYLSFFWFWVPSLIVKRITVISEFSRNQLIDAIPWAKKKIIVVPNAVHEEFSLSSTVKIGSNDRSEKPIIFHLGTKLNKNLDRLISAITDLNVKLIILGELSSYQLLLLEKGGIHYKNHCNLSNAAVISLYQSCDIVSFASTYEGFGMPIIEAQTFGKPVVTSNFGAMKEVAGEGALLVDPFSIQEIRKAIQQLISQPEIRKQVIKAGYSNVKRFDIESIVNKYVKLYQEVSSEK